MEAAEKSFLRALELDPNRISTITNLAKVYHERGQFDRAIEFYHRVDLHHRSYLWWGNLGATYKAAGQEEKARQAFDKAVNLITSEILVNPNRGDLHSYLGLYRALLGRAGYREPLQVALRLAPADLSIRARVAEAYAIRGDRELAADLVKQLIAAGYDLKTLLRSPALRTVQEPAGVRGNNK